MEYLADTVAILRHLAKTGKIGRRAKSILDSTEQGKHHIYISVISLVEIMFLSQKKRIKINLKEVIETINNSANYSIVDLTPQIVMLAESTHFPELHDRLILSTAKYLGIPMLTSDEKIQKMNDVKTIWK